MWQRAVVQGVRVARRNQCVVTKRLRIVGSTIDDVWVGWAASRGSVIQRQNHESESRRGRTEDREMSWAVELWWTC